MLLWWFCPLPETFKDPSLFKTDLTRLGINLHKFYPFGDGKIFCRFTLQYFRHESDPNRGGSPSPCFVLSKRPFFVKAHPYSSDQFRGIANKPSVHKLIGCSRFGSDGSAQRSGSPTRPMFGNPF